MEATCTWRASISHKHGELARRSKGILLLSSSQLSEVLYVLELLSRASFSAKGITTHYQFAAFLVSF